MLKFRSLTNVRPTKDLGSQIICAPTYGQFKVTPDAAKAMSISAEDSLQLLIDDSTGIAYAVKGSDGLGGKLASSNKVGGGLLSFSAAAAWDELKGDTNFNTHYDVVVEDAIEDEDEEGNIKIYFPLKFVEKVEKQTRKKKDADGNETDEEEEVEVDEVTPATTAEFDEM
jgi:hypothetical protein